MEGLPAYGSYWETLGLYRESPKQAA